MEKHLDSAGCRVTVFEPDLGSGTVIYYICSGERGKEVWEQLARRDLVLAAVECTDWNRDMSPWPAPGVYNAEGDFEGGAGAFLTLLTDRIIPDIERTLLQPVTRRGIAGYSMAGLFALWCAYNTELFTLVCSGSGSTWYDGWLEYMAENRPKAEDAAFYISVGTREKKTRNARMAKVEKNAKLSYEILCEKGFRAVFELNPGNHFNDPAGRIVKGIERLLDI